MLLPLPPALAVGLLRMHVPAACLVGACLVALGGAVCTWPARCLRLVSWPAAADADGADTDVVDNAHGVELQETLRGDGLVEQLVQGGGWAGDILRSFIEGGGRSNGRASPRPSCRSGEEREWDEERSLLPAALTPVRARPR